MPMWILWRVAAAGFMFVLVIELAFLIAYFVFRYRLGQQTRRRQP